MAILDTLRLAWVRHCEFNRVMAELGTYTDRELVGDLRVDRADFIHIAGKAADIRVAQEMARLSRDGRHGGLPFNAQPSIG